MVIKTVKELDKALEILSTSEIIAFDFETMPSGLFPEVDKKEAALHHKMCELEGLALRSEKLDPIYIPISDTEIPRVYLTEKIGTLFSQESLFVAHNIQFDAKIADYFFGARPKNKFCTLVGYWYLDENTPKDAKTLGKKHFDIDMIPYDEAKKLGEKDFYDYAKRDAEVTYRLYFFLKEALEENYFDLASTLEMNFIDVLIDMTLYGTPCDFKYLKEGERILTNKVLELEAKIYKELGEFNINSPQQLCEKLYGIKIKRKKVNGKFLSTFEKVEDYDSNNYAKVKAITETGAPSTKEEALEKIDTPAAKLLKEYRGIMKLLSTYAIGYQKYVIDNKIYPTFNNSGRDSFQYGTVTGRLSSSAPNMQNISHEPTEGWWLREAIYAKDGYKLIVADEAQLEMRLLAHFSKDPHLIEAIKSGEDIHLATAKIIFGKEEISSEERRFAKCVSGDTRITTGGGISKIQDISSFRREDDYIDINKIVWDGNSWVPATKFYYSGYKRAKKISFSKGYTLTCSLEHPVMTKEGWKKAKELQLNDEVLLGKGGGFSSEYQRIKYNFLNKKAVPTESSPTVKFDEYWARMLGYILGDGCTTGGCMVSICNGDDSSEVREDISNLCKELGLQEREWKLGKGKTKNLYLGSTNFHNFLEASGLFLGSKKVFSVPEIVFHSPKSVVKEFLRGLFETDGWVEAAGSVGFCSKSKQLCQDIQILLLNFGIISSIDESYNTAYQKMYWKIRISGYYSQIFSKEIGFISTRKQTLLDGIQVSRNMISQYVKVKAIEDVESELFDLVVPSTNSFVGNGLVCHNTQNFSTAYGQGIIAMANQLGCSKEEAKKFRFKYFDTFPKIKKYIDRVGEKLEQNGYVKTVLGRKRRIPEVYSNESGIVARAKRQGVNSIIQGSAADVLKAAMVKIHSEFKEKNLDAHILLQIHDELVIECKEEQVEEASAIVKEYMEHPLNKDFRVPLEVEPKICKTWAEGKD